MRYKKLLIIIWLGFIFVAGGVLDGCSEKAPPEQTAEGEHAEHEHVKKAPVISEAVMDSLRVKKRRYRISRDAYWKNKGGVLANDYLEVWYPPGSVTVTHGMHAFEHIVFARERFRRFFEVVPSDKLKIVCSTDLPDYKKKTNRDWWYYAEIKDNQIIFQPIPILSQRGIDKIAIAHEYYQWGIGKLSAGKAPRWLEEGLASYMSDEGGLLQKQLVEFGDQKLEMTLDEVENTLKEESLRDRSRIAYYHAYKMVERLVSLHGEYKLKMVVRRLGGDIDIDQAFSVVFNVPYSEILAEAVEYEIEI